MRKYLLAVSLAAVSALVAPAWAVDGGDMGETVTVTFRVNAIANSDCDGEFAGSCTAGKSDPEVSVVIRTLYEDQASWYCLPRVDQYLPERGDNTGRYVDLSYSRRVPKGAGVYIYVNVWEDDDSDNCGGGGDDEYDISPDGNNYLTLYYYTAPRRWIMWDGAAWVAGAPHATGNATDWRRSKIWFSIQSSADNEVHGRSWDGSTYDYGSATAPPPRTFVDDYDFGIRASGDHVVAGWSVYTAPMLQTNDQRNLFGYSSRGPADAKPNATDVTVVPSAHLRDSSGNVGGLTGCYVDTGGDDHTDSWGSCTETRFDRRIDFDDNASWPGGSITDDTFRVRWTGEVLTSMTSGTYTFCTASDDGSDVRLQTGGSWTTLYNNWTTHHDDGSWICGGITLNPNTWYPIRVYYHENSSGDEISLGWSVPQGSLPTLYRTYQVYGIYAKEADASVGGTLASCPSSDLDLFLYDQFGVLLASAMAAGCPDTVSYDPGGGLGTSDGPYFLLVGNYGDTDTRFTLNALAGDELSSTAVQGKNYVPEGPRYGFLIGTHNFNCKDGSSGCDKSYYCTNGTSSCTATYLDDDDYYQFWVENGEPIQFTADPCSDGTCPDSTSYGGSLDLALELYNPSGGLVTSANPAAQASGSVSTTANATGLWYVKVIRNGGWGTYFYEYAVNASLPSLSNPTSKSISISGCDYTNGTDCWMKASKAGTVTLRTYDADSTPGLNHLMFGGYAGTCTTNGSTLVTSEFNLTDGTTLCGTVTAAGYLSIGAPTAGSATAGGLWGCYRNRTAEREFQGACDAERADTSAGLAITEGNLPGGIGPDDYNVEWWGEIQTTTQAGTYKFCLDSDDGGFIAVNKQVVMDDRGYHGTGAPYRCGNIYLGSASTWYPIRAGFFENGGGSAASLYWTPPGGAEALIPTANMRYGGWAGPLATVNYPITTGTTDIDYDIWSTKRDEVCTATGRTCGSTDVDTTWNLRIDVSNPTTSDDYNNTWRNTDFAGTITCSDGTRSGCDYIQYCIDTDGTADCTPAAACAPGSTCNVTVTCAGGTVCTGDYVRHRAYDNVGNLGAIVTSSEIRIDKTNPTTSDDYNNTWRATDFAGTITCSDTGSACNYNQYCIDTDGTADCTPATACAPGSTCGVTVTCGAGSVCTGDYVRHRAYDNAGNVGSIVTSAEIRIDKQGPPTVPGSLAVMLTGNKTLKATWSAASDGTGSGLAATPYAVQIGLTGGDASGCAAVSTTSSLSASPSQYRTAPAACTLTSMADATQYCFIIRASDAVGNTSDSATVCATAVTANEDVAGVVKGFPASAVDAGGNYIGTYVGGNGNVVYLLNSNGVLRGSETLGAAETIVGPPSWINDGANAFVFVTTQQGKLYKLQNDAAGDPPGPDNLLNPSGAGTAYFTVNSCGAGTSTLTSAPVATAEAVWFAGKDTDCAVTERIYAVESKIDSAAGTNNLAVEMVRDAPGCSATSITSAPKVVTGAGPPYWPGTFAHIGSDCINGANVKVYRIDADAGLNFTPDCQKDVLGSNISAWMTGGSGNLYFGTVGPGPNGDTRGFYVLTGSEDAACGTVYGMPAGFPYPGAATAIGNVSRGAKPVFTSEQDEAYFVTDDGKLHCVCTKTAVDAAPPDTCTIAVADRCDGTPSVGQACVGFNPPITLESGVALGEPLFHDGTIYVASNTGRVYAVEALCDTSADSPSTINAGTVKSANGYTFRLDTSGVESMPSLRTVGGASRITVGTDTGRIFYLPVTP